MVANKTRKQKEKLMTIPELRKSFDHMENFTRKILELKNTDMTEKRKLFQKEWQNVFHRPVDDKAANAYLQFELKKKKSQKQTKKQQKGGMAPLDYDTRPGSYGPYGSFPAYITSGFDIYDKINQDSFVPQQCGKENIVPTLPADLGSNTISSMKGGKRYRTRVNKSRKSSKRSSRKTRSSRKNQRGGFPTISEFSQAMTFRPLLASSPSTTLYDTHMALKGQVVTNDNYTPNYMNYRPTTLEATATSITRDLANEMK